MSEVYQGRVWKFGDHVNTDLIMPGDAMYGKVADHEVKNFAFKNVRPEFASEVQAGDMIVAGQNFGCGSSRPAAQILLELKVRMVVAESFAQIFFRNSINLGFPLLRCDDVGNLVQDGDLLEVDPLEGRVTNVKTKQTLQGEKLPPFILQLVEAGGILELLKRGERLSV